jgi:tetratricopeptide (TPR) repeat protein
LDAFVQEYSKLSRGLRLNDEVPSDAFILKILTTGNLPPWLRPVPYNLPPNNPNLKNQFVLLLEVVPNDSQVDALVRIANFLWASNKPEAAEGQLAASFQQNPTYLPALIAEARFQQALGKKDDVNRLVESIRANYDKAANLSLEDHIDLASVFTYVGDAPKVLEQMQAAFKLADDKSPPPAPLPGEKAIDLATYVPPGEHALRRLTNEQVFNMLELGHQLNLLDAHADAARLALTLLPPEFQAKVLSDIADSQARTGHFNEAIATYKKVLQELQPNNLDVLTNLAWILGTVNDPNVRNGKDAVIYAIRAKQLDEHNRVETYDVLACAYAESGNFEGALENARKALQLAQASNQTDKVAGIQKRIDLFTNKQPYRNN